MNTIVAVVVSSLVGAVTGIMSASIKARIDRKTFASNRILELRLEALMELWGHFNDLVWLVSPALRMGYESWATCHRDRANDARKQFKKDIERHQVILDKSVIDAFKSIQKDFLNYIDEGQVADNGDVSQPYVNFAKQLDSNVRALSSAITATLSASTQEIRLELGN